MLNDKSGDKERFPVINVSTGDRERFLVITANSRDGERSFSIINSMSDDCVQSKMMTHMLELVDFHP